MISFCFRFNQDITNNKDTENREHLKTENMDLGFGNSEDNLVNSVNSESMPNVRNTQVITSNVGNARSIIRILNGLSSQKLIKGNYAANRMLIIIYIQPFINCAYDFKEYSRGTIYTLLALRGAIPNFKELITPLIKNNNGLLARFEEIIQNAIPKYIQEWCDKTKKIVISDLGFGQQYDLAEIRKKCSRIKFLLRPYLTKADPYQINYENQPCLATVKPNQIKRKNQPHLPKITEEHHEYDYNELSDDDGEFKEN